ncbi:MAG TPA: hypothetical protein V6C81_24250 [Planktothrix sp.]
MPSQTQWQGSVQNYNAMPGMAGQYQQNMPGQFQQTMPGQFQQGMPDPNSNMGGMQYGSPTQFGQGMQQGNFAPNNQMQYQAAPNMQGGCGGMQNQAPQFGQGMQNYGNVPMGNMQGQGFPSQFSQQMPASNYGLMQPQSQSGNFNYNGNGTANQFNQSPMGQPPMQGGAMTGGQMPSAGMVPQNSHPILNLLKSAFMGAAANGAQTAPQSTTQQAPSGPLGLFKSMFAPPSTPQEAEASAQEYVNEAANQKAQAIDSKNSISGESDKSTRRSYASDANSHADQARSASDKVYNLSQSFPNDSTLSDMASQARSDADYARSMANEAQNEAGGGW